MSVSIIGVGLHPFGRFPISGREMGLIAARNALADAGLTWDDVDFAAGGSRDGGHADALVSELGLKGTPFMSVYNGCATGGSALLAGIWAAAAFGMALKLIAPRRFEWAGLILYLAIGWAAVVLGGPMLEGLSTAALVLICTGGGLYTLGVCFHLWRRLPFQNAIWHVLVLTASFVFYAAVLVEIVRRAPPIG